ncbi:MAG: RES domain-containing protein, partial [Trueperaceae bacterium]
MSKATYRNDTMSGVGAYRAGGRWNSSGHHAVYAAGNLTL